MFASPHAFLLMRSSLFVFIVTLAIAGPADANVARWSFPGSLIAEPAGLREISIEREELEFDLRRVEDGDSAGVAARYYLVHAGDRTITAPLVFVSGIEQLTDVRVTFDGRALTGNESPRLLSPEEAAALPAAWSAPRSTPDLDGSGELGYETHDARSFAFTLAISPGRHQLTVEFRATPAQDRDRDEMILWQLGYVLAPARQWGGFGILDVSVTVPPDWRAATSPGLMRFGDTLRGWFSGLPGDTIGITLQPRTGSFHRILQIAAPVICGAVVLGGIAALVALGRARRQRRARLWGIAIGAAVGWALAIGVTGFMTAYRAHIALPAGARVFDGYDAAIGSVLALVGALFAIPLGVAIVVISAGRRRPKLEISEEGPTS